MTATGIVLLVLGLWLIARTVRGGQQNLVHKILPSS